MFKACVEFWEISMLCDIGGIERFVKKENCISIKERSIYYLI
jgi:hypothetical protein